MGFDPHKISEETTWKSEEVKMYMLLQNMLLKKKYGGEYKKEYRVLL